MSEEKERNDMVSGLLGLKERERPAILAALRTGVGKPPGAAPRMLPFMARYLTSADPENANVVVLFTVASLYAKHPKSVEGRSLGLALWHSTNRPSNPNGKHGEAGVASRFAAAIDADPDDLPRHLDALISLCASADQGLDWFQFRWDLYQLIGADDNKRDGVRLKWARHFWQGERQANDTTEEGNPE